MADYPSVGLAEPANGPDIFDRCLEELEGFLVVGGAGVGAW